MTLEQVLAVGKVVLPFVSATILWLDHRRSPPRTIWLVVQMLLAASVECYAAYLASGGSNNLWVYNWYVPLEFVLLLLFIGPGMTGLRWKITIALVAVAFVGLWWADIHICTPQQRFVSSTYIVGAMFLTAMFVAHLVRLSVHADVPLIHQPMFWNCLGHVFFFAGMIPTLGLLNVMNERDPDLADKLYRVNDVLFFLRYGLISYSPFMAVQRSSF
ncbi:MAG: hypothetical protein IPJ76_13350 [Flavobacteriales bacterium]|nr:MAG: hypothetical protein IPJ76_13350 [Flavobacteriales bacterium]